MSLLLLIIILVTCILLEGFFSGSEMAVVNASKMRLVNISPDRSRLVLAALHLVKHPAKFFSTTLLGTNLCTVVASVVTTFYLIDHYGPKAAPYALVIWPFTLIFAELVPKSLYHYYADRLVLFVSPILLIISFLLFPVVWLLSQLTDLLLRGVKKRFGSEPMFLREELELLIRAEDESQSSDVKPFERTLISRIFDLAEKKVELIKTPLIDVAALPDTATREEAERFMEEKEHSRIPIYSGKIYNIVGVLMNTDLLLGESHALIRDIMHAPYYVPEEMPLDELFISMKRRGDQLAVVVDEYGAATGVVTAEDVFEEVVGEIRDEHDEVQQLYHRIGPKRYLVNGRLEVSRANERLKLGIPEGEYQTVAGFVVHVAERIPKVGETISLNQLQMTVRRANERAVQEVEIAVLK
ncbi:MAG: HlyC/CorC family transporter [Deltaproteobacteria bacterium]|nr:HlyC/CorC family transporter [Deltaproteobacteria bacterium]